MALFEDCHFDIVAAAEDCRIYFGIPPDALQKENPERDEIAV